MMRIRPTAIFGLSLFALLVISAPPTQSQELELVVQSGHTGEVKAVAFSPNGKYLASAGDDGSVRLWDVETGLQIKEFSTGEPVYFQPADFTTSRYMGDRLINGQRIHAEWHLINELFYGSNPVSRYLFSLLARFTQALVAKQHDRPSVELAKAVAHDFKQILDGPSVYEEERFKTVELSPESKALLQKNPSGEELIKLNRSLLQDAFPDQLKRRAEPYNALVFSHNGKLLAGRSSDNFRIWTLDTGVAVSFDAFSPDGLAFSPDDQTLAVTTSRDIELYKTESGAIVTRFWNAPSITPGDASFFSDYSPKQLGFSLDGKRLLTWGYITHDSSSSRISFFAKVTWPITGGRQKPSIEQQQKTPFEYGDSFGGIVFSPSGQTVIYETFKDVKDGDANRLKSYVVHFLNSESGVETPVLQGERASDDFDPWVKHEAISSAFSFDSKRFAVAKGRSIVLYDAFTSAKIRNYDLNYDITGLTWSHDNSRFAIVSGNSIAIFDLADGKTRNLLTNHSRRTVGHFESNGQELVFERADEDQSFDLAVGNLPQTSIEAKTSVVLVNKKWNVQEAFILDTSEAKLETLEEHLPRFITERYLSPNGQVFAEIDKNTINLTDKQTDSVIRVLSGHTNTVLTLTYSPDGRTLASGSADNTIKLWDVATGRVLYTFKGYPYSHAPAALVFSKDSKLLAGASENNSVKIWDTATGTEKKSFPQVNVLSIAFSRKDDLLAVGGERGLLKVWNIAKGTEVFASNGHSDDILCLAFDDGSEVLASGGRDKRIKLWDIGSGRELRTLEGGLGAVVYVGFLNAQQLLSESLESVLEVRDKRRKQTIQTFRGLAENGTNVLLSPDRKTLAFQTDEGIQFLDVLTGKPSFEIKWNKANEQRDIVKENSWDELADEESIVFGKDKFAVSFLRSNRKSEVKTNIKNLGGINTFTLKVWSLRDKGNLESHSVDIFDRSVERLFFSPDGRWLIAVGLKIWLWDTDHPGSVHALPGVSFFGDEVTISGDNKILAVADHFDNGISLWDVAKQEQSGYLTGHTSGIYNLAFRIDKNILMSQSHDGTTKFWDAEKGKELATLTLLDERDWVVLGPGGRFDASPNAMKLMHYVYGLEVITLEQLKDSYYEPGLLTKLIGISGEPLRNVPPLHDVKLFPEIVSQELNSNNTVLRVQLRNRGGGIGPVRIAVNGKTITEDGRDRKLKANPFVGNAKVKFDLKGSSFIKGGPNKIEVYTNNYDSRTGRGYISSRANELRFVQPTSSSPTTPTLYAIIGGISNYAGTSNIDLRFASKDAEDMSTAVSLSAKRLFGADKVHITVLSTSGNPGTILPTKTNFESAFADVAKRARPEDILFIYLSGHGVSLGLNTDTYFYLTQEALNVSKESLANPDVQSLL